jgi:hypothetical protein
MARAAVRLAWDLEMRPRCFPVRSYQIAVGAAAAKAAEVAVPFAVQGRALAVAAA